MDPVFQLVLVLAWILGYLPVQKPFIHSNKFLFKWNSLTVFYSVFALIIVLTVDINFLGWNAESRKNYKTSAHYIMATALNISSTVHDIFARLVGIVFCSKVISLIQNIESVQAYNAKHGLLRNSKGQWFNKCKFYIPYGAQLVLNVVGSVLYMSTAGDEYAKGWKNFIFPSSAKWMVVLPLHIFSFSFFFCRIVTSGIVVCFGVSLLDAWKNLFDIFQAQFSWQRMIVKTIEPIGKGQEEFAVEFSEIFHQLQDSLALYGEFIGYFALLNVFDTGVTVAYSIYQFVIPRDVVTNVPTLIHAVSNFLLVIFLGNTLEAQIEETGECVEESLLMERIMKPKSKSGIVHVAKSVSTWRWNFTAKNIFTINNALIPAFLGALVTCMTFIIQLDMSETGNNKANGTLLKNGTIIGE